jgi:putative ABC transport system permease protein
MFKNYFKTAFRNLARNKNYTIINISGLAIGIAVCIMIFIIIQFHSSFDNFHKNKNNIYRVLTEYHHADSKDIFYGHGVPSAFPKALKTSFTQLAQVAPVVAGYHDQLVLLNGHSETIKKFKEESGLFYTSPSFFSIFDFPLLAGSYETLKDPNNVLLTKETAEKYYGDWKSAIGKTIKLNNTDVLKVTGILATIPANTDFQLKLVVSYGTGATKYLMNSTEYDGTSGDFGCYILLPENINASAFNNQLIAYSKKVKSPGNKDVQTIQPLLKVHYDTQTGDFSNKTISHTLISILWLIASFILVIACVNFINLSTAQAVNRAKEVGIRKVLGSNKWQLRLQFITETLLIVLASVFISLIIVSLALPYINKILELPLKINLSNALSVILLLFIICIAVTILAGFYPSVVLSGFNPITALKNKLAAKSNKGISLRRGLVVFQFIIAQSLIIGTLIIVKQMNFFTSQPLGFDKEAIVNIPLPTDSISNSKLAYLKQQLKNVNGIHNASFNSTTPVEDNNDNWAMFNFDHAIKQVDFYSIIKMADNDYVPVYKLPLVAGRNIEASDTMREVLVNEMVLKNLGIKNPQDALNKEISFGGKKNWPIVGVVKDFYTRSFRDGMAPLIITSSKNDYNEASIKLASKDVSSVMNAVEKIWNATYPDFVFEYKFLDDKVDSFYKQENQLSQLYKIFASIAIFLSCLGLYGLASFMAVQRIKEVGIRKVLGATASNIVYLFSKEFIILIAIAFAIATPIAWYFMQQWLQNYPFRIEMSWWIFIIGGLASVLIALITVSFQAIKAAVANPVKSLRTE